MTSHPLKPATPAWIAWVFRVDRVLAQIAALMVLLVLLLTLFEVISRRVLQDPAIWAFPVTSYLLLFVVYLGTAFTLEQEGHVRVGLVVDLLPPRWRKRLNLFGDFMGLVFVLILGRLSWNLFATAFAHGQYDETTLHVPLVLINFVMPLGLGMMALTYLGIIFRHIVEPA